jgi:hypothetical protein
MDDDAGIREGLERGVRIPSFHDFECIFNVSRINPTLLNIQIILPSTPSNVPPTRKKRGSRGMGDSTL